MMTEADLKSIDARLADLEDRMDNVVKGSMVLTDVVENLNKMVSVALERTDLLRSAHLSLVDGVKILGDTVFKRR